MQEGREGGQGVSEEIQGEQQRAIAYSSKLPLTSREGHNAVAERSCAPQRPADAQVTPALFPTETSPDQTSPTDHLAREGSAFSKKGERSELPGSRSPGAAAKRQHYCLFVLQFEGSINVLTQMMVDPAVTEKRGGGKNLPLRRGEILDVIQFTDQEHILCRNSQRRCKSVEAEALPAAGITAHKGLGTSFFMRTHAGRQQETSPCR